MTWSAYLGGFRAMLRRWPLVLVLWLIGAAFGLAFALAAQAWLAMALEGSLASRALAHHLDPDVLVDLWYHHGEGLRMLGVVAAVLAVAHVALWWWLDGVIVAAVRDAEANPWREGLALAPVMARLYGLALLVALLWSGAVAGPTWALLRSTREHPGAYLWYQIGALALAVWLLGMVVLVAVHDHARLRAGLAGDAALRAYGWALRFVLRDGEATLRLALLLQLSAGGLLAASELSSLALPLIDLLGLTGALLLGEVFLLARSAMRVWFFTAERRLQP
ncbi:MAG TPA: hypothetical protein VL049_11440 [Candidatus Dormibacteraeota bacterium]|nr:hypothetical protein [Candidatus Dormibacteraeota bacterium]